jgi:NADH-quinone oxidoreductase subunit N
VSTSVSLASILAITPEILLLLLAIIVLLYDHALKPTERRRIGLISAWGGFATLLVTLGIWIFLDQPSTEPVLYWGGMISQDLVTLVFRIMFLLAVMAVSLISMDSPGLQRGEYYALLLISTIGFSLMAASVDLIMIYLALETASISLYVLSDFTNKVYRSNEAGMKYFIYGAFATAVMLYGLSLLFGLTQETNIFEVARVVLQQPSAPVLLASALVVVGFGFKISAVPFHF